VKTAGRSPEARTLVARLGVEVTLGEQSKNPAVLYSPPCRHRRPSAPARQAAVSVLADGRVRGAAPRGREAEPLFIEAHNEDDLVKAVLYARSWGSKVVPHRRGGGSPVVDLPDERKIPVLFNAAYAPGRRDSGDAARPGLERRNAGTAAALARAACRFALIAPKMPAPRDLLFLAAAAVRHGISEKDALAAVTLSPAEILGVVDRVGSDRQGAGCRPRVPERRAVRARARRCRRVMINGESRLRAQGGRRPDLSRAAAIPRARDERLLAIKGGRVPDGHAGILPTACCSSREERSPTSVAAADARRARARRSTRGAHPRPGFVDLGSHLGFHLDRTDRGLRRSRASGVPATTIVAAVDAHPAGRPGVPRRRAAGRHQRRSRSRDVGRVQRESSSARARRSWSAKSPPLKFSAQGGPRATRRSRTSWPAGRKYHDDWEAYERNKREPASARDP
jgi:hypothetical protein